MVTAWKQHAFSDCWAKQIASLALLIVLGAVFGVLNRVPCAPATLAAPPEYRAQEVTTT